MEKSFSHNLPSLEILQVEHGMYGELDQDFVAAVNEKPDQQDRPALDDFLK